MAELEALIIGMTFEEARRDQHVVSWLRNASGEELQLLQGERRSSSTQEAGLAAALSQMEQSRRKCVSNWIKGIGGLGIAIVSGLFLKFFN